MTDELDLSTAADAYDIPAGDITSVIGTARRAAARRRATVGVLAVVAVVTGAVSLQAIDDDRTTEVPLAAEGGDVVRGDAGVSWRIAVPDAGLGGIGLPGDTVGVGTGPLYALSTAAGERLSDEFRRNTVLWQSTDGVDWTAVSALDGDLYLADLAASDGRIYAVGTIAPSGGASRSAPPALVAGWSDDDGKSFARAALPLELAAYDPQTTSLGITGASVGSGPAGTLVVASVAAVLDVPRLLPDGVTAPNGWVTTTTGVDLLGSERNGCDDNTKAELEKLGREVSPGEMSGFRCASDIDRDGRSPQEVFGVIGSYTFEQLGVDDELRNLVLRQPVVFHAPTGSTTFTRVELPETDPVYGTPLVETSDAGFEIVAVSGTLGMTSSGAIALRSADGRTFSDPSPIAGIEWVTAIGRVRGTTTIVGSNERGAVIARSDGAGGWRTSPLAQAIDPDLLGNRVAYPQVAGIGDFGVVVSVVLSDPSGDRGAPEPYLLVSRDGTRWSDGPLADLVPDQKIRSVSRVVVTGERVVVSVAVGDVAREGPSPQVALVGFAS